MDFVKKEKCTVMFSSLLRKEGSVKWDFLTFKGGIHPDDGKRFSKDQPIKALLPTGDLIYPLSQHIGAPAVPVVKKETRF